MRELSLFSGAGGGLLGTKLLGWETVGYVEFNDYCQRVLKQRILDGIFDKAPIFGDIRVFISEGYAESYKGMVDVITAGFPCQPFSVAGKGLGVDDPRNMWPETKDCISIIRPRFAFLENVPGLLTHKYIQRIFGDLAEMGYDCIWKTFCLEYGCIERERIFIAAVSNEMRLERNWEYKKNGFNLEKQGIQISKTTNPLVVKRNLYRDAKRISRANYGVAHRVDRLKAIGNGQVPAVVKTAWEILSGTL